MSRKGLLLGLVGVVALGFLAVYLLPRERTTAFERVEAIVDAMNEQGVDCREFRLLEAEQPGLKEFGLCYVDGGEYEIDIYLLDDPQARADWLESITSQVDVGVLWGENWVLTAGTDENAREIQEAIGGVLVGDES